MNVHDNNTLTMVESHRLQVALKCRTKNVASKLTMWDRDKDLKFLRITCPLSATLSSLKISMAVVLLGEIHWVGDAEVRGYSIDIRLLKLDSQLWNLEI